MDGNIWGGGEEEEWRWIDTLIPASLAEYAAIKRQFAIGVSEAQAEDQAEDE